MLENKLSKIKTALVFTVVPVLLSGCFYEPITKHHISRPWRSDVPATQPQIIRQTSRTYDEDNYMNCSKDASGHEVCYCRTKDKKELPCNLINTPPQGIPFHPISYKKR